MCLQHNFSRGEIVEVASCDELWPSSLELRHHVVMLNSKHGSSRSFVLPPTTSQADTRQPTPSKWLTSSYICLLDRHEYDRRRPSARPLTSPVKRDVNAIDQTYAAPYSFHGTEGFRNKVSTDSVCCIDISVSSALGYKDTLPLFEMDEHSEHGRVTMTTYGSSRCSTSWICLPIHSSLLFTLRPPVHVNTP